ncbi:hypothetical protein EELLY_v1c03250 [Entomoplasma ellychniae]|uniref:Uncharacterized protein n=1 Tax=Entomoplasma ellychniae TaxID=2114 RepID=A0A8E2QZC0_9MOLU|nr:hypothetical protein EELLY_v1c03250 [Entomoplasma ellychniae]
MIYQYSDQKIADFLPRDKNVVVGFSYFVPPIVNCYLES